MIWLTWKGLSLLGLQSHCENAGFQPFGKKPLILAVAALWGTSITKVPFNQMVMLTGGWPDWRWLYIWNGPTNLDIRLPVAAVEKKKIIFSEVQNKNLHEPCVPPCCPLMLNGLCSYENQTGHPEAAGAIVKSDCFLCILSLHVKYDVLEQNWPSAAPAVAQDVRSQSFVFNSGVKMWKDADFQFCWDLTILNVFFLAQSRL